MTDEQQFLSQLLYSVQISQAEIQYSISLSASHSIKNSLEELLREYNRIENDIQTLSGRRGLELQECQPGLLWYRRVAFRIGIGRMCTDSRIAETTIRHSITNLISLQHNANFIKLQDQNCLMLLQKVQDCVMTILRRMQIYL